MGLINSPQRFSAEHKTNNFSCGDTHLDEWIKKQAIKNQHSGASRTFVICKNDEVIGYYTLAGGSVERLSAPGNISRNMPDPIPVIVLGRLAVDINFQRSHLGSALLKDAMLRTLSISLDIGVRALLVHAISPEARGFYLNYGFQESKFDEMTLFLSIKNIKLAAK